MKLTLRKYGLVLVVVLGILIPTNTYAVDFKDHTEYIPEWAIEIGEFQALMTCANMEYGTSDQKWCLEYSGYYNDKITKELEAYENQDYSATENQDITNNFLNPDYVPMINQKIFQESPKKISYNTLAYTNELYGFFIAPPKNWSTIENVELIGGEEAAPVGFYSNKANPTYIANFIIVYTNMGSSYFDLLRFSSDQDILNEFADGYTMVDLNSKITSKNIESFLDGYKVTIDSVHTIKLDAKKFESIKKETVVFILESGEMYSMIFASMADDFDSNVGEFRKASQTFYVGDVEFESPSSKQTDSEPICGKGTELVDGVCQVIMTDSKNKISRDCLIATASYGSELAPQVQMLREVRDNVLLSTESGVLFMKGFNTIYYSFSPEIAQLENDNPTFKEAVKIFITPMISTLSIMTMVDEGSESQVILFGMSTLGLIVGMYIVAPAIIIIKVSKQIKK